MKEHRFCVIAHVGDKYGLVKGHVSIAIHGRNDPSKDQFKDRPMTNPMTHP